MKGRSQYSKFRDVSRCSQLRDVGRYLGSVGEFTDIRSVARLSTSRICGQFYRYPGSAVEFTDNPILWMSLLTSSVCGRVYRHRVSVGEFIDILSLWASLSISRNCERVDLHLETVGEFTDIPGLWAS